MSNISVIGSPDGPAVDTRELDAHLGVWSGGQNFVTATVTGNPSDPDVTLYLNGVEL